MVYLVADITDGRRVVAAVGLPDAKAKPGTVSLTSTGVEAFVLLYPPGGGQDPEAIYFLGGDLTLTEAGTTAGAPWKGSLTARMWDPPWF